MTSRDVFKAILAEKVERHALVVATVLGGREEGAPLQPEEVELLCIGYKSLVDRDRTALHALRGYRAAEGKVEDAGLFAHYVERLTARAAAHCTAFLELLEKSLSDVDGDDVEAFIQRKKTVADYHRYVCELRRDAPGFGGVGKTDYLYKELLKLAEERLESLSTLHLTVAINYAVFAFEVKGERTKALAFDREVRARPQRPQLREGRQRQGGHAADDLHGRQHQGLEQTAQGVSALESPFAAVMSTLVRKLLGVAVAYCAPHMPSKSCIRGTTLSILVRETGAATTARFQDAGRKKSIIDIN